MKNLKNIIRKNLDLISEQKVQDVPFDYITANNKHVNDETNVLFYLKDAPLSYNIAVKIVNSFRNFGSNFNRFNQAISQINNLEQYQEVEAYLKSFYDHQSYGAEHGSILSWVNDEAEMDNVGDIKQANNHLRKTIGWELKPVYKYHVDGYAESVTFKWEKVGQQTSTENKSENKKEETKNNVKTTNKTKPSSSSSVTPKSYNNNTRDIQTLISKTKYKDILPTKKTPSGIDGYWGHRTSQALMSLLNDYQTKIQGGNLNNIKVKGELDQEF